MSDDRSLQVEDSAAAERPDDEAADVAVEAGKGAASQRELDLPEAREAEERGEEGGDAGVAGESVSSDEEVTENEVREQGGGRRATERDVKALQALIYRVAARIGSENEAAVNEAKDMLARVVESFASVTGRVDHEVERFELAAEGLEEGMRVHSADFDRWHEANPRSWQWLAIFGACMAVPVLFGFGVLVEQQFQIVGVEDPTGGWRDHIWENYGRTLVDCATEAMRRDAEVSCTVSVHKP